MALLPHLNPATSFNLLLVLTKCNYFIFVWRFVLVSKYSDDLNTSLQMPFVSVVNKMLCTVPIEDFNPLPIQICRKHNSQLLVYIKLCHKRKGRHQNLRFLSSCRYFQVNAFLDILEGCIYAKLLCPCSSPSSWQ